MNQLNRCVDEDRYRAQASHAMRYLAGPSAEMVRPLPGVLLADEELVVEPTHMTIAGHRDDAPAQSLACAGARAAKLKPAMG